MLREYCPRCDGLAIVLCSECGALCCLECECSQSMCACGHEEEKHGPVHSPEQYKEKEIKRLEAVWARHKKDSV